MKTSYAFRSFFGASLQILCATAMVLSGCSSSDTSYRGGAPYSIGGKGQPPAPPTAGGVDRFPWDLWAPERDAIGEPLQNQIIIRGDGFVRAGDRKGALVQYELAGKQALAPAEREGLAMRLAAVQLTLDQPELALGALSDFFRSTGRSVNQVGARFSLLFGYAYARKNNFIQALAWFSRCNSLSTPASGTAASASAAVRKVLATLDNENFEQLAVRWQGDPFIHQLIGESRKIRAERGDAALALNHRPFWEEFERSGRDTGGFGAGSTLTRVGVLLPLSGQHASLGASVKNGIELARDGSAPDRPLELVVRDTLGQPMEAVAKARQLIGNEQVGAVLGPLLADEASSVGDVMSRSRIPLVSFSKRSDFHTGFNIFRIAPTAESQIDSLLSAAVGQRGLRRFAMIYPEDASGDEFSVIFRAKAEELGARIVYAANYPKESESVFVGLAQEVELSGAEAVFFPDGLAAASRFFATISEGFRKRIRPLGLANWDSTRALLQSANALQGALYVSPFFVASDRPLVKQFVEVYQAKYRGKPDFLAAQGFDAASMLFAALTRASSAPDLGAALHGLDAFEGVTGRVSVSATGEFERIFPVIELRDGKLSEVGAAAESAAPLFQ